MLCVLLTPSTLCRCCLSTPLVGPTDTKGSWFLGSIKVGIVQSEYQYNFSHSKIVDAPDEAGIQQILVGRVRTV